MRQALKKITSVSLEFVLCDSEVREWAKLTFIFLNKINKTCPYQNCGIIMIFLQIPLRIGHSYKMQYKGLKKQRSKMCIHVDLFYVYTTSSFEESCMQLKNLKTITASSEHCLKE